MEAIVSKRVDTFKDPSQRVGVTYVEGEGAYVRVWAPDKIQIELQWVDGLTRVLNKDENGYFCGQFPEVKPGDLYAFVVNGKTLPDPASRFQPHGVSGPSAVVADDFKWTDQNWKGIPYDEWVIYELHVGTFSERGDFQGVIDDLPRLKDLGITVIEVMPVSQFPGARNWGYDGVFPHAVQNTYGGPEKLKELVDACHAQGIAIILDVVYNHLGPEGDVLSEYSPYYFQDKYATPWGSALNFDEKHSENVRNYFLQSGWQWLVEFHFDGLRLDAIHTIFDTSPIPFLEELSRLKIFAERERGFPLVLIGETDRNDARVLASHDMNGLGIDGQWADDLHHSLHVMITGETGSYYIDFVGGIKQLAAIYRDGVAFQGEYSFNRGRCHGRSYAGVDKKKLVVQTQNHDQIGNRIHGRRLNSFIDFDRLKLTAASIFLSPFMPLFFMGEELNLDIPFHYFVNHESEELLNMIRKGRNEEFSLTMEETDPASEELFQKSTFALKEAQTDEQSAMQTLYKDLIAYSKKLRKFDYKVDYDEEQLHIILTYTDEREEFVVVMSYNDQQTTFIPAGKGWNYSLRLADYGQKAKTDRTISDTISIPPVSAVILTRTK